MGEFEDGKEIEMKFSSELIEFEDTPPQPVFVEIKSEPPDIKEEDEDFEDEMEADESECSEHYQGDEEDCEGSDRKRLKNWNQDSMIKAVTAIRKREMGLNKAEKVFNVPKTSLRRYVSMKDKTPEEAVRRTRSGRKPVFSKSIETELVDYLLALESRYFGITKHDIRTFAFQLAMRKNLTHNFSHLRGNAGKDWMNGFLNRHRNRITIRKDNALPSTKGLCGKDVSAFFDVLESEIQGRGYPPSRIYSVDDTALLLVQEKTPKVLALKGKTQKCIIKSAETGLLLNVVACMNAEGTYIPPLMVFPREDMQPKKKAPEGTTFSPHLSFWLNCDLFFEWFLQFINLVKPTETDPVLLILDGQNSYTRSVELLDKSQASNVNIVALPPHTWEKLHPLEVFFMRVLKDNYIREVRIHRHNTGQDVKPGDIAELFAKSYFRTQTKENAVNGFKSSGIYPLNRGVFTDVDFAPDEEEEMLEIETMMQQELSEDVANAPSSSDSEQ